MANEFNPSENQLSTEKSLIDVVKELKSLNESTKVAKENVFHTQNLAEYMKNEGSNLDKDQLTAIQGLITAINDGKLDDMEADNERIKRNEERNDLLEKIAKHTGLNLDVLKNEFGTTDKNAIVGLLIRTALTGTLLGILDGIIDSYKFLGKGLLGLGKMLMRISGADKFVAFMRDGFIKYFKQAKAGFTNLTKSIFKGGGSSVFGQFMTKAKNFFNSAKKVFVDLSKILKTGLALGGSVLTAAIGVFKGRMLSLAKAFENSKLPKMGSSVMKFISGGLARFFKPMGDFMKVFKDAGKPLFNALNSASGALKSAAGITAGNGRAVSSIGNLGTRLSAFFKGLKPIQAAMKTVSSIGTAFRGFGRVLGRLFLPISILMSIFDTVKGAMSAMDKFKDAGFFTKLAAGIIGAIGGLLKGLVAIPIDLLFGLVTWIGSFFLPESVIEGMKEFSLAEIFDNMTANLLEGLMELTRLDFGDAIKNVGLSILKVAKKILSFPYAIMAGGAAALAAAINPLSKKSAMEAFSDAYNGVMNLGDTTLDNLKTKAPGTATDQGPSDLLEKSGENAARQAIQEEFRDPYIDAKNIDQSTKVGDTNIIHTSPIDRTSSTIQGPHTAYG